MCIKELVVNKFGNEKWKEILKMSGIEQEPTILPTSDVDDSVCMKVIDSICKCLNLTLQQVADAFGEYWMCEFAPQIYSVYYTGVKNAKEFLLKMDYAHYSSTRVLPDARPPRFDYEWIDDKTLIMHYKSHRGLIDFMVGLIKGVGKYFNEDLRVRKLDNKRVEIVFEK